MQCPRCQHENPVGLKVCGECGGSISVGVEHERLVRLVEPYTPEGRSVPRWLLFGVLATALVGVLGAGFLSGTGLLARYAAKGVAPVDQPSAHTEPDDPAALASPFPQSSPDPASPPPPAHSADR